jgi:hypothetical protein
MKTYQKPKHVLPLRDLILISLVMFFQNSVFAASLTLQSVDTKVNILEVYTSQGCSSCPPAEHWLTKFEDDPRLWKQFIPINFHVDYWDYIGWKDPFAKAEFTKRQRLYEYLELSKNVATPGFVLNGKGWNGWFYGQQLKLVNEQSEGSITAKIVDNYIQVKFVPANEMNNQKLLNESLDVHVAILGFDVKTKVTRGENNGRELNHDFVVLAYNSQALFNGKGLAEGRMALPDASKYKDTKQAIVVWVSKRNNPSPIQAVGDWL